MELRGVNSVSLQLWTQTCTHTDTHIQNQLCPLYGECLFNRTRLGFWKTLLLLFYFFCFYSLLLPQIVTFDSAVDPSDDPAQGNKWPWTHNLPLSYKSLISSIHILIPFPTHIIDIFTSSSLLIVQWRLMNEKIIMQWLSMAFSVNQMHCKWKKSRKFVNFYS